MLFPATTTPNKPTAIDLATRLGKSLDTMKGVVSDLGCAIGNVRLWRHVKRGSTYVEIGRAEVQASTGPINEGDEIVIYRGTDGRIWARKVREFEDGRFEEI